jgi:hypothetical protein
MASKWSAGAGMTAAALMLLLWLGACGAGSGLPGSDIPGGSAASERTANPEAPLLPVPQPQAAPPARSTEESPAKGTSPDSPVSSVPVTPVTRAPSGSAQSGGGTEAGTRTGTGVEPSPAPLPSAAPPGSATAARTVTVYYVALDDGGSSGVRFGCNDSLVGLRRPATGAVEPLTAAMGALLDGAEAPAAGVYNSLAASTLQFLSGTFDGTTVTVYLSGSLQLGGVCDIPRVEAQLTQTAVSSVGAIRAEIYVNGVGLTEALSLK